MERVTAFVLAGGKSTRMGKDKAFLEFQGRTLLRNALELGRAITDQVRIVGDPAKFADFGTVVEDIYPGRGPLGGIHAALKSSATALNLMIGVDLPLLEIRFLEYLTASAVQSGAVVTVPRVGVHYEPLCAVYRTEFVVGAERALVAGRNKIDALFTGLPTRTVDDQELARHGFAPAMFRNVNTPEDWKLAQEEFARRQHV
ncbi:MAG TPA: molybdenum cofactor guanylyltransferase [Terriglobales bacterium]|nr:molybdenum cofactor guanylyltransferase [Terriglobales bacterium]